MQFIFVKFFLCPQRPPRYPYISVGGIRLWHSGSQSVVPGQISSAWLGSLLGRHIFRPLPRPTESKTAAGTQHAFRLPGALVFTSAHPIPTTSYHSPLCPTSLFSLSRTHQAPSCPRAFTLTVLSPLLATLFTMALKWLAPSRHSSYFSGTWHLLRDTVTKG